MRKPLTAYTETVYGKCWETNEYQDSATHQAVLYKFIMYHEANTSFLVISGVRQECIMSSVLFIIAIDWVMITTLTEGNTGMRWTLYVPH